MRFSLAGNSLFPGPRARRARFPTCGVIRVAGSSVVWDCGPTSCISPKEHQKERCGHFSVAALLHFFLWCASEYSVVGRISCYVSHDSTRTNVCQWSFAKKFLLLLLLNRIDSIRNLFIIFALDFPALENPISEKTNCRIQPSSHSSHASSSSSNQSGLLAVGAWRTGGLKKNRCGSREGICQPY